MGEGNMASRRHDRNNPGMIKEVLKFKWGQSQCRGVERFVKNYGSETKRNS